MASQEELEEYSAAQQAVVVLAAAELAEFMAGEPDADDVDTVFADIVQTYGRTVASLAADFYDDQRARSRRARGRFTATPAPPASDEWIRGVLDHARRPRLDVDELARRAAVEDDDDHDEIPDDPDEPESEPAPEPATRSQPEPDIPEDVPEDVPEREDQDEPGDVPEREPTNEEIAAELSRKIQRMIRQAARDTIVANAARDPSTARWARVPKGPVTCAFCLVMASRGAVYTSRAAATSVIGRRGRPRGSRALGERYHDECDCEAVPIWDEDEDFPDGYNPDDLYQQYRDARDAVKSGDLRTILAELRRQQGLR
ncbi:hypothetical protein IU433_12265 [Nocardia puris]|uniref:VG15 protein n=1 Tax=Nocardia puris TaxID=208602 RepID=UPI001895C478|nr:hypothetical protein [Nocardia puris]MBF6459811.1 hypothetical protein [Nocardia puris]